MHPNWILSLPEEVFATTPREGEVLISGPGGQLVLEARGAGLAEALLGLEWPGQSVSRLTESLTLRGAPFDLAKFIHHARFLARRQLLQFSVHDDGGCLLTLYPTSAAFSLMDRAAINVPLLLSRFAHIRRLGEMLAIESPVAAVRVTVNDHRLLGLLHQCVVARSVQELEAVSHGLSSESVSAVVSLLAASRILTPVDSKGIPAEDSQPGLCMWEFHDLLMHARSRLGRHDWPAGATFQWAGVVAPPPAVRDEDQSGAIPLYQPDIELIQQTDMPFAKAVARRCSEREFGAAPISSRELGDFLFRVARVESQVPARLDFPDGPIPFELTKRPYPSAGALYEMEFYPLIQRCEGLPQGLYRYDPVGHRLLPAGIVDDSFHQLLAGAAAAAGIEPAEIQVLMILSSRPGRLAWKYASIAYSLTLKHVGVLFESMYLTATTMNLAGCALGAGDSDIFAIATRNDYYTETSVGEFLIGSKKDSDTIDSNR